MSDRQLVYLVALLAMSPIVRAADDAIPQNAPGQTQNAMKSGEDVFASKLPRSLSSVVWHVMELRSSRDIRWRLLLNVQSRR